MAEAAISSLRFNYAKLRGRTVEMEKTDRDVAKSANMTPSTYSLKLNGKGVFTQDQICSICGFLEIPLRDVPAYFFTPEV